MARLNVNPTRMELNRLKKRLRTARRGHKLLKDKRDELMKKFITIVKENIRLREDMEKRVGDAHSSFVIARAVMQTENLEEALMFPKKHIALGVNENNVMSVRVPYLTLRKQLIMIRTYILTVLTVHPVNLMEQYTT